MLSGESTNTNLIVFGLIRAGLEPTICHTQDEHINHYTNVILHCMIVRIEQCKSHVQSHSLLVSNSFQNKTYSECTKTGMAHLNLHPKLNVIFFIV